MKGLIFLMVMLMSSSVYSLTESEYVDIHCKGEIEYRLPDRTRVDCLLGDYAIEYDFAKKYYEAIGQSLHYGRLTGKLPGIVLIVRADAKGSSAKALEKVHRAWMNIKHYGLPIKLWVVYYGHLIEYKGEM